ncbi:MAG: hypothetical protein KAU90_04195 [Sulfurovaceae bacterium]|nr:hypothetical protein [Sulfurovaceae bacterium]
MNDEYAVDSYNTVNTAGSTSHQASAFPFLEMGTSFVIGLAVGYFLKKFFKLFLLLTGLALVVLFVLESKGTIHIDDKMIESGVSSGVDSFQGLVAMVKDRLSSMKISSGASAVAGFFAGIKFG